jgi:hypothetical protein
VVIFGALVVLLFAASLLRPAWPDRCAAPGIRLKPARQRVGSVVESEPSIEASSADVGGAAAPLEFMAATESDRSGSSANHHSGS